MAALLSSRTSHQRVIHAVTHVSRGHLRIIPWCVSRAHILTSCTMQAALRYR